MTLGIGKAPVNLKQGFESFFRDYEDAPNHFKYKDEITVAGVYRKNYIYVQYEDILSADSTLAEELFKNPDESIQEAVEAFKSLYGYYGGKIDPDQDYFVRIKTNNKSKEINLRKLRASHIDKLVYIEGILIRASQIIPQITEAHFSCPVCQTEVIVEQIENALITPKQCSNCKNKLGFIVTSKTSKFIDWQSIVIQESPEELQPGRVPYSIKGILTHELVDKVRPGDRVRIMGIFKTYVNESPRGKKSTLFTPYMKILSVEGKNTEDEDIDISPDDEKEFRRLAAKPNIHDLIALSIAPSILGLDHLKMAGALSLFGGVRKEFKDGSARRGDIHILLVGDPGTGKSIHGAEKVYIGYPIQNRLQWNREPIGEFINNLMDENEDVIISKDNTSILKLDKTSQFYTASIDPETLKTKKTKIIELSRHHSNNLLKIITKSGRKILATPDHSFSTLLNGNLKVLSGNQLNEDSYLPVARKLDLNGFQQIEFADMTENISENDIVSAETIRLQNSLIKSNQIGKMEAYESANITHGTFKKYSEDLGSLPKGDWIRSKYDTSWLPRKIELTEEFGRIIGFYLAEGNSEKTALRITNTDEEIINIIYQDFQKIFQKATIIENGCILCQSTVNQWFKHYFGTGASNKKLPFNFITTPEVFRKGILSAYFSGDGWIEEKSATVNAITKSEELSVSLLDLLATFGIYGSTHLKEIKKGQYKGNVYHHVKITGEELYKFANLIGFASSKKQKKLEACVKTWLNRGLYQSNDMIPNFGTLFKDVVDHLELVGKRGSWERSFKEELRGKTQRQRVGRIYLKNKVRKLKELYDENNKKYTNKLNWLEILANSDIYWDKIATIEPIKGNFKVYDIGTTDGHFIVANGNLIVHNSQILKQCAHISPQAIYTSGKGSSAAGLTAAVVRENDAAGLSLEAGALVLADGGTAIIDEFDKMDNRDRVAIHEAMEQQSYHPTTEIFSVNGERFQIGRFVDNLMKKHTNQVIPGVDCEILPISSVSLYSTDFKYVFKTKIDRISRHTSPDSFYKIKFSNGRSLIVTPEHPMYVFLDGNITTVPAESCKKGMFIPAPLELPNTSDPIKIEIVREHITDIQQIPNEGEYYTPWVYDVTVEPNHTFISQGVILHNTVSVAKAGIIATLRARTSIIAAANPKLGRYSIYKTPTENINLSPPILSRFDLIFVVRDEPNESIDEQLADFILELNAQDGNVTTGTNKDPLIPSEVLQKYIRFARKKYFPKLSPDARKVIRDFYVDLRRENKNDENAAIAVVARNLEGYIRIAEAYARMALRNIVTKEDAEKALKLAKLSLEQTSIDPITGKLDADRVLTGISAAQQRIHSFLDEIKKRIDNNKGHPISEKDLIDDLEVNTDFGRSKIEKYLETLKNQGDIYSPKPGMIILISESKKNKEPQNIRNLFEKK